MMYSVLVPVVHAACAAASITRMTSPRMAAAAIPAVVYDAPLAGPFRDAYEGCVAVFVIFREKVCIIVITGQATAQHTRARPAPAAGMPEQRTCRGVRLCDAPTVKSTSHASVLMQRC